MDRLEHALSLAIRRPRLIAVLFVDLDDFKVVNDSLGHEAGDALLVTVAERLKSYLRPEDTVVRFGGDEFAVLLENIIGVSDATRVAGRIVEGLPEPFVVKGREVFISPSIGIVRPLLLVISPRTCCARRTSPCTGLRQRARPATRCSTRP